MASKPNKQKNGERGRISDKVTIELQDWHPTPRSNVNCSNYYDAAPLRLNITWPADLPKLVPDVGAPRVRLTSLEKCINRSPDMMGEFGDGYWVALARLVSNLNLTLEDFVAGPPNPDMCCRLAPEWSVFLCATESIASTARHVFQGNTKYPFYALKKNGHLQYRLFNLKPLLGRGVRGPHCLGDYGSSAYDGAVKGSRRRVETFRLPWDVLSNRTNNEEMAFSIGERRSFN